MHNDTDSDSTRDDATRAAATREEAKGVRKPKGSGSQRGQDVFCHFSGSQRGQDVFCHFSKNEIRAQREKLTKNVLTPLAYFALKEKN